MNKTTDKAEYVSAYLLSITSFISLRTSPSHQHPCQAKQSHSKITSMVLHTTYLRMASTRLWPVYMSIPDQLGCGCLLDDDWQTEASPTPGYVHYQHHHIHHVKGCTQTWTLDCDVVPAYAVDVHIGFKEACAALFFTHHMQKRGKSLMCLPHPHFTHTWDRVDCCDQCSCDSPHDIDICWIQVYCSTRNSYSHRQPQSTNLVSWKGMNILAI